MKPSAIPSKVENAPTKIPSTSSNYRTFFFSRNSVIMSPRWPATRPNSPDPFALIGAAAATWSASTQCEICFKLIRLRHEDDYHCEACTTIMCKGCFDKVDCVVCRYEKGGESSTFCAECMPSCQSCGGATFHPWCKLLHLKDCTSARLSTGAVLKPSQEYGERVDARQKKKRNLVHEWDLKADKKEKGKLDRRPKV